MEKESHGSLDEAFTGNISVVKWKENKVVNIASNKTRSIPLQKARGYDRVSKKFADIDMPNSISTYYTTLNRCVGLELKFPCNEQ